MSNIICCADLHITAQVPIFRTDNYLESCLFKLKWIIKQSHKYKADIIIAGDLFDSIKVGYKVVNSVIEIFKKSYGKIIVVPGQHDKYFHSPDLKHTPIYNVSQSKAITLIDVGKIDNSYPIYGLGHDFPDKKVLKGKGILVTHRCITEKEPPFFLKEATSAENFMKKFSMYSIIITGDYHIPFVCKNKKQILVNCGSMMRKNKDQIHHKPRIYIINRKTKSVKAKFIPICKAENVFDFNMIEVSNKSNFSEEVSSLVEEISQKTLPDFLGNLRKVLTNVKTSMEVSLLITKYVGNHANTEKRN